MDATDSTPETPESLSFYAYFMKAEITRTGEVRMILQVPADNKYDAIALTDVREKMWLITAEKPPTIESAEDLDKLFESMFGGGDG